MTTHAPQPIKLHLNNFGGNATSYAIDGRVGSPGIPILAHVASPVGMTYGGPEATVTGIRCGTCSEVGWNVRHASVDHVRECAAYAEYCEDQARAEAPLIRAGVL